MRVTKIVEQVKNKNRVSVFVDGKYAFSLSLDQLLKFKLKVGSEIDGVELKKLKNESAEGKLKMRALEWLMIRPHSASELRDYLKRKKLEPEAIKTWAEEFQSKNYQNDTDFTRWWVEQRRSKGRSIMSIKYELRSKGISTEIIDEYLAEQGDKEILRQLITKKRRIAKYKDDKKLTEYLVRQGFRYSLVKELLAELAELAE
jgi:regulatory protein